MGARYRIRLVRAAFQRIERFRMACVRIAKLVLDLPYSFVVGQGLQDLPPLCTVLHRGGRNRRDRQ